MNKTNHEDTATGGSKTAVSAAAGAAIGAVTGATIGAVAGPPGMAVGAAIGAAVGGTTGATAAATVNPAQYNSHFQQHYAVSSYYQPGYDWNDYQPAYEYGYHAYDAHRGRPFEEAEGELASQWASVREGSRLEWEHAKQAVRDGWHYIETRRIPQEVPACPPRS